MNGISLHAVVAARVTPGVARASAVVASAAPRPRDDRANAWKASAKTTNATAGTARAAISGDSPKAASAATAEG